MTTVFFPAINEITQGDTYISTVLPSDASSLAGVVTSVATLPSTSDQMLYTGDSCVMLSNLPISQPYSQTTSQLDHGVTPYKHIVLADPVMLSECALYVVNAKVKSAVSGTDIFCYAQ